MLEYITAILSLLRPIKQHPKTGVKTALNEIILGSKWTGKLFLFGALLVGTEHLFGPSVACFAPRRSEEMTTYICLNDNQIYNYEVNGKILDIFNPEDYEEFRDRSRKINNSNIRYMCFALLIEGFLFGVPYIKFTAFFEALLANLLHNLTTKDLTDEQRKNFLKHTANAIWGLQERYDIFVRYVLTAILVPSLFYFHMMTFSVLLDSEIVYRYPIEYIKYLMGSVKNDPSVVVFPRIARCNFEYFGVSGTIQRHDAICYLTINATLEKFFIFSYIWLLCVSLLSFAFIMLHLLKGGLDLYSTNLRPWVRIEQHFILYLVRKNLSNATFNELMVEYKKALPANKIYHH